MSAPSAPSATGLFMKPDGKPETNLYFKKRIYCKNLVQKYWQGLRDKREQVALPGAQSLWEMLSPEAGGAKGAGFWCCCCCQVNNTASGAGPGLAPTAALASSLPLCHLMFL